jgi:hypothetical protein
VAESQGGIERYLKINKWKTSFDSKADFAVYKAQKLQM